MKPGPLFTRRAAIAGAIATSTVGYHVYARPRQTASLTDFGGVGDGRADNAVAFRRALMAAGPNGELYVPAGRFLICDRSIHAGEPPFEIPSGMTLRGAGSRAALRFRRERFGAFYGLTIKGSAIHVRDIALEVETSGSGWTAGVGIVEPASRLRFTNVAFRGIGNRAGHYGILPLSADIDGLTVSACRFETLDFGFARQTTDTSVHRGFLFEDCVGEDCTEVFEINAPGLGFIEARAGSDVIEQLLDESGRPLDLERLRIGQEVRSEAFPPGTVVAGRDPSGRVRLSRAARITSPRGGLTRISSAGASGGVIRNLVARNIGQWAVGFAHCDNWDVDVVGEEIAYELVHIEDGSRNMRVVARGSRCNLEPGVVGSPGADNGMVHISTGSSDIAVRVSADLTRNASGYPAALCVQAGGLMGTTGREVAPTGISVAGRVLMRAGTRGVIAYDSGLHFDGLELINPDPASRADPMMRLPGCTISGTVRVHNSGQALIFEERNRTRGSLERVQTI